MLYNRHGVVRFYSCLFLWDGSHGASDAGMQTHRGGLCGVIYHSATINLYQVAININRVLPRNRDGLEGL